MNKGVSILGVWISITTLIIVLIMKVGIEFIGIIFLLGIAAVMTVVILHYEEKPMVSRI
jgi:hypothetical protein